VYKHKHKHTTDATVDSGASVNTRLAEEQAAQYGASTTANNNNNNTAKQQQQQQQQQWDAGASAVSVLSEWSQYADDNGVPYWYSAITGVSTYEVKCSS
jgi:hypothetical protein